MCCPSPASDHCGPHSAYCQRAREGESIAARVPIENSHRRRRGPRRGASPPVPQRAQRRNARGAARPALRRGGCGGRFRCAPASLGLGRPGPLRGARSTLARGRRGSLTGQMGKTSTTSHPPLGTAMFVADRSPDIAPPTVATASLIGWSRKKANSICRSIRKRKPATGAGFLIWRVRRLDGAPSYLVIIMSEMSFLELW